MSPEEINEISKLNFDDLWNNLWKKTSKNKIFQKEYENSKLNFNKLIETGIINDLINKIKGWDEPEWGFPKGRRNNRESDYDCAIREFSEETGYESKILENLQNIIPYEEIFTGSNYKSYKHKYFLMYIDYNKSLTPCKFEKSEVSKMEWKNYENSMNSIRNYNVEKKRVLSKIFNTITQNIII
jgi:ADP-ribose pyrophosphatase YjhB (NUDIX family)